MKRIWSLLKKNEANAMVENVIILPVIFIIIYAMILTCFVVHDKGTVEAAAKRGAIYAAHCISDPNYAKILEKSGNSAGTLDTSIDISGGNAQFSFSELGKNIQPYRYLTGSTTRINDQVKSEVMKIVKNTRIPWRPLSVDSVQFQCINKVFYQDITVTVKADYPIPEFFSAFGIDTEYDYEVSARMAVNDPDEFIRNADLVVDLITEIDNATGNHMQKVVKTISDLATKLLDWFKN